MVETMIQTSTEMKATGISIQMHPEEQGVTRSITRVRDQAVDQEAMVATMGVVSLMTTRSGEHI